MAPMELPRTLGSRFMKSLKSKISEPHKSDKTTVGKVMDCPSTNLTRATKENTRRIKNIERELKLI
jgi:hypothetical protein